MTLPFWTKEKKQDYLDLYKQREQQRKYNREYMQKARNEGKYKYYRDGAKIKYKNLQTTNNDDDKKTNQQKQTN